MIDEETYKRFEDTRTQARKHGVPLIEALDHRSLLWTEKRERDVKVGALEDLLRRLEIQSPNRLLSFYVNRPDGSASEMLEAVKEWVGTVARRMAEGTLED